ncbi:uncharacterized protein LOC120352015 [Nilaparvata lugens]|uniref:uncharacterized protein LOC120352015 n=1 Tax=Nilaparvata lugens TaxID=108931 RepID=UPI00193DD04B|nr:uncharacterized protein LOC120352015 [Nilaparvata lugens]
MVVFILVGELVQAFNNNLWTLFFNNNSSPNPAKDFHPLLNSLKTKIINIIGQEFQTHGPIKVILVLEATYQHRHLDEENIEQEEVEFYKTGGGTFKKSLDDEGERFVALMEPKFFPMKNYGDSDDGYHQKEIEIISMDAQAATSTDEVQDTEASVEVIDIGEEEIIIQPSVTVENNNLKRKTQSEGLGTKQKKKRYKDLKDCTRGKVDINKLKIEMMRKKHELELQILKKTLELEEIEVKIKQKAYERM